MRIRAVVAAFFAGAALLMGAARARADEPISIDWDAPAECPTDAVVRASVVRWLELTPENIDRVKLAATARVWARQAGDAGAASGDKRWHLDLSLVWPGGRQDESLDAARCDTIVELVALKVALAADPERVARDMARKASVAERPPPAPSEPPVRSFFGARARVGIASGLLPNAAVGFSVVASFERDWWRAELGGQIWLSNEATYPGLTGVGAEVGLAAGQARACLLPEIRGVAVPVCAGFALGDMHATGFGVLQPRTSSQLWAAVTVGPSVRLRLEGPAYLWLEGEAWVVVDRPAFHVRNLSQLYQPDPEAVVGWGGVGFELD